MNPWRGGGGLISGSKLSIITSEYHHLVIKFTPETNYGPPITVTINDEPAGTSYDPATQTLTIQASDVTGNIIVTATATQSVTITLSGGNCTIKSITNGTVVNSTTAVIPVNNASDGVTIVVEGIDGRSLSSKIQVTIDGQNVNQTNNKSEPFDVTSGAAAVNGVSYNKNVNDNNWTISIDKESITGNVTITCPTYVISDYNKSGFTNYKCITFDNVSSEASGKWIIIGANGDSETYGAGSDYSTELDPGQVLLLSEGCIKDDQKFHSSSNNWSTSSVRITCGNIYNNSGLGNYNVIQQNLITKYLDTSCNTNDNMFLLGGRLDKFNAETYLTTEAKRDIDVKWWLRSGYDTNDKSAFSVYDDGYVNDFTFVTNPLGVRPAFVLQI